MMVHHSSGFLPLLVVIHLLVMSWPHHHIQQVDAVSSAQQQEPQAAFMATTVGRGTSMSYDDVTDRIYITGDRDDDCWLGILQLPATTAAVLQRRHHGDDVTVTATSATWIRNVNLGLADQTESCTAVRTCRTGNSRRLFITGISFGGSSLLQQTTNETTTTATTTAVGDAADNNTAAEESSLLSGKTADTTATTAPNASFNRTSGWLWDISWYGEVIGGYARPQHVPTSLAASCDRDVYVTWLYGTGGVRLTRIGRAPLHRSDALTTPHHHYGTTFRGDNMTISTVKALAQRSHSDAESYDQYAYLQEPWTERWSRDVPDASVVYLFDDKLLVILSGSLLITVDIATGMLRREVALGEPRQQHELTGACHTRGSEFMYVLGHDLECGRTTVWCIEMATLAIDWTSDFVEDRVATVCDVTSDDQRVYVAGDFGLTQLDAATGDGVWNVDTIPVSALVSDRHGNAVVLSNSPEEDTVTIQLVERLTGRRHGDALSPDQGAWLVLRFLGKYHLYVTTAMTIAMILIIFFAACLVMRRSAEKIGATRSIMQSSGRASPPRCTKRNAPQGEPRGLASCWEDKKQAPKCQDMDPLLRTKNFV